MKRKFYLYIFLFTGICSANAQQVIVTDDATYTTPASGAVLDIKSTNKGFMMPRVDLDSIQDITTVPNRTVGLMVYNTGVGDLKIKGVYFWNGTIWEKELTAGASATNYVKIGDDGTVTLNGGATTYTDLVVNPYVARNSGVSAPGWTLFCAPGIFTWEYLEVDSKELFFTVQLPHDYKIGSRIFPHVHWSTTVALGTNRVMWELDYQWVDHLSPFSQSSFATVTGYTLAGPARSVVAYEHIITPLGDGSPTGGIDGTGKGISSILLCRLRRTATNINDNFAGSAFLLSFDFHYEIDSFGSNEEYVK